MFWDNHIETMSRDEMNAIQASYLRQQVAYAYTHVPFYKSKMDARGIRPEDIKTLEDKVLLPFTTKADLRDNYPFGFCAVPPSRIARFHASSGTSGKPIPSFYTRKDLDDWAHCVARNCHTAGVRKDDICQMAFKYTLFTGAFGHHAGVEKIGAAVIPASSGQTERQVMLMLDFKTTVLHCTPSYAITIAEKMTAMGIERGDHCLRLGIHGAEPMSEALRNEIEEILGTTSLGDYGLTELGGPGVSIECPEKAGYHINEDFFLPEIVDPDTLIPLPEGCMGELVFTSLQKEAFPILRYRTRDITTIETGTCVCGRTLIRHAPIMGRSDDMLIIGGVNFFPSQLENLMLQFDEVAPHYMFHLTKRGRLDHIAVNIETTPRFWADAAEDQRPQLARRIEARAKDLIGFKMAVQVVAPMTFTRSEGKAKRLMDERAA